MNNSTRPPEPSTQSVTERNVKLGFYVVTIVLGLLGNVLVLMVVLAKRTRLKSVNDIFIMNLAISDLVLIFILPVDIYTMFHAEPVNVFFCNIYKPFATVSFFVSIFTLTSMAIHRCHVILNPFVPDIRPRTAVLWIAVIWIFSFVLLSPMMIFTKLGVACEERWPGDQYRRAYTVALFVFQYLLPLLIIAVAYIKIGLDLNKSRPLCFKWLGKAPRQAREDKGSLEYKARKRENAQVIKTLAIIVLLFAICLLPIQVAWLLMDFGGPSGKKAAAIIFKFSLILAVFHSCLNPLVYGTITKRFRKGYFEYLSYFCRCCKLLPARQTLNTTVATSAGTKGLRSYLHENGHVSDDDAALILNTPKGKKEDNNQNAEETAV